MSRVWVYKCNSRTGGDWYDFFADPGNGSWGGTQWTRSPASARAITDEMAHGDYVLSYDSHEAGAIGLCKFLGTVPDGPYHVVFLQPLKCYDPPVAKERLREAAPGAFRQGDVRTIYDVTRDEGIALLELCRASTWYAWPDEWFEDEDEIDCEDLEHSAAVFAVAEAYRRNGWSVSVLSLLDRSSPLDLRCRRAGERRDLIVVALGDPSASLWLSSDSVTRLKDSDAARLALVFDALGEDASWKEFRWKDTRARYDIRPDTYALKPHARRSDDPCPSESEDAHGQ